MFEKLKVIGKRRPLKGERPIGFTGAELSMFGDLVDDFDFGADPKVIGPRKWRTYKNMLANVSIVSAGILFFLNLAVKSKWSFKQAEGDEGTRYVEEAERMLMEDPKRSFQRIVRRAAMYRFYGFSLQEWVVRRRDDGVITLDDLLPRPPATITKWHLDRSGLVDAVNQRDPATNKEVTIPRDKCLYLVNDSLSDSPEGLGVFRHLHEPVKRLVALQKLEGIGFQNDLRGIPFGKAPLQRLAEMVAKGQDEHGSAFTEEDRRKALTAFTDFLKSHIKGDNLALMTDSAVYHSEDEAGRPSTSPLWSLELLRGGVTGLKDLDDAIIRVTKEIARIMGLEQLLLGEDSAGSFALAQDKTRSFYLLVDSVLGEIARALKSDVLTPIWEYNGWSLDTIPTPTPEAVRFNDIEKVGQALQAVGEAVASGGMAPDDPAVNDFRRMLGISDQPEEMASFLKVLLETKAKGKK